MLRRVVAVGLLTVVVGACGGGGSDEGDAEAGGGESCPRGVPTVRLTHMAVSARPDSPTDSDVTLTFEVDNPGPEAIVIETLDLYVYGALKRASWPEPPRVAASETATVEGQMQIGEPPANLEIQPDTEEADLGWRWEGERHADCAVVDATFEPVTGDITEIVGPAATPPPRDLLALGETATFPMPTGQEVRLTVTGTSYSGTCPEPGAGPPLHGARLFVSLRLEVTPGSDPWLVNAGHFTVGGLTLMDAAQAGLACAGPLGNNLQAAPGQTAEGVFVYDTELGPSELTYRFSYAGQPGTEAEATWDLSAG